MATTVFGAGLVTALNTALQTSASGLNNSITTGCQISLFVNNHVPTAGDTLAAYTAPTTTGCSAKTITNQSFSTGFNANGQNITVFSTTPTWTVVAPMSSPETVYGWFVQSTGGSPTLIYASTVPTPFQLDTSNQIVIIDPIVSLSSNIGGN